MNQEQRIKTSPFRTWQTKCVRLCLLLFVSCFIFAACEPDTACHQELGSAVQITLSADSITSAGDTVHYTQWDSITVVGIGSDIGMQGKGVKVMGLELRPDTSLTAYLMLYHNQIDTLYIQHTPRQQFISLACGCAVYHTITAAWSSDSRVDSVSIINASVEPVAQDNLCIYLHE
ncbi:MAG: hypothetical protein IKB40_06055 [Paludibacteraceae bacterium]|nr:hypothetical protein [Paludibacteraceae bacterium]